MIRKADFYDLVVAILLLGVVELYVWSQGNTLRFEGNAVKTALIAAYLTIAIGSQCLITYLLGFHIQEAVIMNSVVAVIVSVGLTAAAFTVHPGLAKGASLGWISAVSVFLRYLRTIGLVTFAARFLAAGLIHRFFSRK